MVEPTGYYPVSAIIADVKIRSFRPIYPNIPKVFLNLSYLSHVHM